MHELLNKLILKKERIILILFFLLIGIWTIPLPLYTPGSGLDASWVIGVNKAVSDNMQFGPEIAFTFGPLGFLYLPIYIDHNLWFLSFVFMLFVHFLFFFSLALLMFKSSANWREYIIVLALVMVPIHFIRDYELLFSVGIFLYLIISYKLNSKYEILILSICSLLLAIASLIKSNMAIISLSYILVFLLVCIFRKEFKKYSYICILYIIFVPILWLISGQHLNNFPVYLINSYQSSSGYNDAMAFDGPVRQIYIGLISVIFISILFLYSLIKRTNSLIIFILLNIGLLFLAFKHGFVRLDSHVYGFFSSYAIIFIYIYIICKNNTNFALRVFSLLLSVLLIAFIFNAFPYIMEDNILQKVSSYEESFSLISNQTSQAQVILDAKNSIRQSYPLDYNTIYYLNNKTVDIFPWDIALVWAYDFNWSPRPVFQSYSAYTQYLDGLNAKHFSVEKAPQAILYSYKSIDGRYPLFDEPSTFASVIHNYTLVNRSGEFLLLSYDPEKKNTYIEKDLGTVTVEPGQPIKIPKYDSGYVFGYIDLEYSNLGKFMKLIYKPALAHIKFKSYYLTSSVDFRFIPDVSKNGVFLSQFVGNNDDLASIFSGNIRQNIYEMIIDVDNPLHYEKHINIRFVGIPANISIQETPDYPVPDWNALRRIEGGIMSIESVGKNQYSNEKMINIEREKEKLIQIKGWAADNFSRDGTVSTYLVLGIDDKVGIIPTKKISRPDIADYYGIKSYIQSGWSATVLSKEFDAKCYNISLRILRANGREYYELAGTNPICFS